MRTVVERSQPVVSHKSWFNLYNYEFQNAISNTDKKKLRCISDFMHKFEFYVLKCVCLFCLHCAPTECHFFRKKNFYYKTEPYEHTLIWICVLSSAVILVAQ